MNTYDFVHCAFCGQEEALIRKKTLVAREINTMHSYQIECHNCGKDYLIIALGDPT